MPVLDKDYVIYNRIRGAAMLTILGHINNTRELLVPITEEALEKDPKLLKLILEQLQAGSRKLLKDGSNVRNCMNYPELNNYLNKSIKDRLEELRESLRNEDISYGEIAELQSLADSIDPEDVELREAAGLPEK